MAKAIETLEDLLVCHKDLLADISIPEYSGKFGSIPLEMLMDGKLRGNDLRIFGALASFAGRKGFCFPSLNKISDRSNIPLKHISDYTARLQIRNYIRIVRRGRGKSNIYVLTFFLRRVGNTATTTPALGDSHSPELGDSDSPEIGESIYKTPLQKKTRKLEGASFASQNNSVDFTGLSPTQKAEKTLRFWKKFYPRFMGGEQYYGEDRKDMRVLTDLFRSMPTILGTEVRDRLFAYLKNSDPFLVKHGHPLSLFRWNAYCSYEMAKRGVKKEIRRTTHFCPDCGERCHVQDHDCPRKRNRERGLEFNNRPDLSEESNWGLSIPKPLDNTEL